MQEQISDSARLWASERDYVYHNWKELITPQFRFDDKMVKYRQSKYKDWKMACTIISALTAIWNNCWIKLDYNQVNRCIQWAKAEWYSPKKGWYVQKAVWYVKQFIENEYWMKLAYFRAYYPDFKYLASKWFQLCGWYNNHEWVTADKFDDWILWNDIDYWDFKYWHAFNLCEIDWKFSWLDNYVNHSKRNIFQIQNINELVQWWIFFKYAYFYVNLEEVKKWYEWLTVKEKIAKLKERPEVTRAKERIKAYESKQT